MRRRRTDEEDDAGPEVTDPKTVAAGLPAVVASLRHAARHLGGRRSVATLLRVNQTDGFDCPGCAWPEPEHRSRLRVLRERRQGRGRGGDAAPDHRRRSSPQHPVADLATRSGLLARPAGPPDRADGASEPGRDHYEPMTLGRGVRPRRRRAAEPGRPRRGGLLHVRAHQQRGRVRLPAVRPALRHEQPARLLEHVPRVERRRRCARPSASARARSRSTTSTRPT